MFTKILNPAQAADTTIRDASETFKGLNQAGLLGIIGSLVNWLLGVLAVVAVGAIVYAGYLYITAGADEKNIDKAKKILLYGAIGVIVALLSFAVVSFAASLLG